jgi:hypothetical protein
MAAECLVVAKQTSDLRVRASLLELAQKWVDLAELSEHAGPSEGPGLGACEAAIGAELRTLYKPPRSLPPRLFALLIQLNLSDGVK